MDAGKLDPLLAKALREEGAREEGGREEAAPRSYAVLIRVGVDLDAAHWSLLAQHGVARSPRPGRTITASLPRAAISALSDEAWVETIRLAQTSRPLAP